MVYTESKSFPRDIMVSISALILAGIVSALAETSAAQATTNTGENTMTGHPYVGMWITADGYIRHELLPNNRYDEARGERESAYQERYKIDGNHIVYWDDTGFTADGEFIDDVLYHGGMVLRRER